MRWRMPSDGTKSDPQRQDQYSILCVSGEARGGTSEEGLSIRHNLVRYLAAVASRDGCHRREFGAAPLTNIKTIAPNMGGPAAPLQTPPPPQPHARYLLERSTTKRALMQPPVDVLATHYTKAPEIEAPVHSTRSYP